MANVKKPFATVRRRSPPFAVTRYRWPMINNLKIINLFKKKILEDFF
jgi:hypothetical protein